MKNKYNAKKQIYKGIKFDSKRELARYLILEKLLKDMTRQIHYFI